jgi:hypothetical protein
MRFSALLLGSVLASASLAHPGSKWAKKMVELEAEITKRAATPIDSPEDSNELLGDLIKPGPTTPVGKVYIMVSAITDIH